MRRGGEPGAPIPEESKDTIWERYQRVQHQEGRHEGTGIGLSLVSKILPYHGFKHGAESIDGYNVFWFSISPDVIVQ